MGRGDDCMSNDHSPEPKPAVSTSASRRHWVVLGLIIATGISLRFYGLYWGYPVHLHCDENTTLGIAVNLGRQFLQTGSLRPQASCYGALSLYLLLIGLGPTLAISQMLGLGGDVSALSLGVGRTISALADSSAIILVYLIGRRVFGKRGGLIAAALYATALLPVREAHFFTVDPLATVTLLIFLLLCVHLNRQPTFRNYLLCGIGLGIALATKTSVLPLLAVPVIIWLGQLRSDSQTDRDHAGVTKARVAAIAIIVIGILPMLAWGQFRPRAQAMAESRLLGPTASYPRTGEHSPTFWRQQISSTLRAVDSVTRQTAVLVCGLGLVSLVITVSRPGRQWAAAAWRSKGNIIGTFGAALGVFILLNPHAVLSPAHYWLPTGPPKLLWNLLYTAGAYREVPLAWTFQFVGTQPYLYQLTHVYPYALGWPLMIVVVIATVYWLARLVTGQAGTAWPVIVAMALLLLGMAGVWVKMIRYVLPQIPLFCLLGGGMLAALAGARQRWWRGMGYITLVLTLLVSTGWCVAYLNIYRHPDNRLAAVDYVRSQAVPGSNILIEEDDTWGIAGLSLWTSLPQFAVRIYDPYHIEHDYYGQPIPAEKVDQKRQYLQGHLQWADYLILTGLRRERISHLSEQFPVITKFYRQLFGGELGWRMVAEFNNGPRLGRIRIDDSGSEPTFRLFDHPQVYVFAKTSE